MQIYIEFDTIFTLLYYRIDVDRDIPLHKMIEIYFDYINESQWST